MKIDFHRNFDKRLSKLNKKQKNQFKLRLTLFVQDQTAPTLNNHLLKGTYEGYRSLNAAGDIRAIYIAHTKNHVEFVDTGTHSQLYG